MQIFIDNRLIKKTILAKESQNHLIEICVDAGILADPSSLPVIFGWPSLLEIIGLGSLLEDFPAFHQGELYSLLTSSLKSKIDKEFLIRLYDQVFVECLTEVKALPEIDSQFLLEQIQKRRHSLSLKENELFALPLHRYEKLLKEHPANAMHDLILYLAWDRVCVNIAQIFEYDTSNTDLQSGLQVLKECLLESFQHIKTHGRTVPGFFRLIETLYAYQMREENLQTHSDSDWLILCQSASALRPREELSDVIYIDAAIAHHQNIQTFDNGKDILTILTLDTPEKVKTCLAFARFMLEKLKLETPEWPYILRPVKVLCLESSENDSEMFLASQIFDSK